MTRGPIWRHSSEGDVSGEAFSKFKRLAFISDAGNRDFYFARSFTARRGITAGPPMNHSATSRRCSGELFAPDPCAK
jgi:hypothetical protein